MSEQDLAQADQEVASPQPPGDPVAEPPEDVTDGVQAPAPGEQAGTGEVEDMSQTPAEPGVVSQVPTSDGEAQPPFTFKLLRGLTPFWHDRLIEAGLILSMGLYYLVGNGNAGFGFGAASNFLHLPPYLYSLPFLAIFAFLSWYRLSFALALMPLSLPYYFLAPKAIFSHGSRNFEFSLAEITLAVCALVAIAQLLRHGKKWRYYLSLAQIRERVGPFLIPILAFAVFALISIVVAIDRQTALRAFHEEIFAPLLYVLLALYCLRTRGDVKRLLWAFLGSALIIAIVGLAQYFFFSVHTPGYRVDAMYGSPNSIGLFFDYALPLGIALLIFQVGKSVRKQGNWLNILLLVIGLIVLLSVLYFSQSLGTALALPVAFLFILALSVRKRKNLLIGVAVLIVLGLGGGLVLHKQLLNFITHWHDNSENISTTSRRIYLWLSGWHMIQAYPWLGVGMDNWLCHYSVNNVCAISQTLHTHFMVVDIPGTMQRTGLDEEPWLSHPHDIFLQVWVSIGIFGLLAFVAILALFYWLFARIVKTVRRSTSAEVASLEWIVLGIGGAMLAALAQGLIDSSFLEQDLAFCFWMLVASLLIMRVLTGTPWRGKVAN